ncbi:amino acid adenylation domain-containing protein [Longispora urticae]
MSLARAVASAVRRHPEEPALEVRGAQLTYTQLWHASGQLAREMADLVPAPRRVGLLGGRSLISYAGYLAALRLGATVVPMNPQFPAARTVAVASAAGVDLILVDDTVDPAVAEGPAPVLLPRLDGPAIADGTCAEVDGAAVAYILFTSGSTGTPKGVPITHASVLSYVRHITARYGLGPGCRLTQNFDLTFDPSVFDLFGSWVSGATLVAPEPAEVLLPTRYVNRRAITHWFSVPSTVSYARRARTLAPAAMSGLRWSIFIGEPLTLEQAEAWRTSAPGSQLENVYGPTELTVSCTEYRLPATAPVTSNRTVPIGAVLPGLEWILVRDGAVTPDEGELCVRGTQRFPGYLDPADNAERFLRVVDGQVRVHAGGPVGPDHWYRTGDRVRSEDGELVHLGRLDRQIKLRGYRVELGEIEAALRQQDGVDDAAVLCDPTGQRLHAFYTGRELDGTVLVAGLAARLPAYMVPAEPRHLADLPLNPNGKTDYLQLSALLRDER